MRTALSAPPVLQVVLNRHALSPLYGNLPLLLVLLTESLLCCSARDTPLSVAMMTDQSVPMMTTKSIAASVCPNQRIASGSQQTLGSVCKPSASTPSVSSQSLNLAVS